MNSRIADRLRTRRGTLHAEVAPPFTEVDTSATAEGDLSSIQPDQPTSSNPELP
ncbi:UNVERIFIED_CONTAM: hypothetical protein Slati_1712900 [Sesamum latifolium]|uniref:Uncharacterized protein n=1 Tax=Sesamum latifolium TaxID=2727402 RepID=A0AAW2WWI9_9LAMI